MAIVPRSGKPRIAGRTLIDAIVVTGGLVAGAAPDQMREHVLAAPVEALPGAIRRFADTAGGQSASRLEVSCGDGMIRQQYRVIVVLGIHLHCCLLLPEV